MIETYLKAQGLFRSLDGSLPDPDYTGEIMELNLDTLAASVSGPKRPHDLVKVADLPKDFNDCLKAPIGFKGFNINEDKLGAKSKFTFEGQEYELQHGSVVIAAITSCTNTSNPSVML